MKAVSALFLSGALLTGAAVTAFAQAQTFTGIRLSSFRIEGAPTTVRVGTPLVFNIASSVTNPHNLAIDGNGISLTPTTPNIAPDATGTVTLGPITAPGTYTLYCPVGQHRANGMSVTITAVAGAAALPATGGAAVPAGLAIAGLASGVVGFVLRRRAA